MARALNGSSKSPLGAHSKPRVFTWLNSPTTLHISAKLGYIFIVYIGSPLGFKSVNKARAFSHLEGFILVRFRVCHFGGLALQHLHQPQGARHGLRGRLPLPYLPFLHE